jgi:hypothetical protein
MSEIYGGWSGPLISFEKFEFVLAKMPSRARRWRRLRALVDSAQGRKQFRLPDWQTTLFLIPRARNSPAESRWPLVNNNEIYKRREFRVQKQRRSTANDRR